MRSSLTREKVEKLEGDLGCHALDKKDMPDIHALWSDYARQFNCCGVRHPHIWNDWLGGVVKLDAGKEAPKFVGAFGDSGLEGYSTWGMTEEEPFTPHLTEVVYRSKKALASLLKFVLDAVPSAGQVGWDSAMTQAGQFLDEESREVSRKVESGHMARVISPEAFLTSIPWIDSAEGKLHINLTDPVFGESSITVEVSEGICRAASGTGGLNLDNTVQVFTQIATGYLSPEEAVRLGRVENGQIKAARLLSGASGGRTPMRSYKEPG